MALQFPENPVDGEFVSDSATGRVWQWDDFRTRWVLIKQYFIPVPGPTGAMGPQGLPGPQGESIRSTEPGPQGDKGDAGFGVKLIGDVQTKTQVPVAESVSTGDAFWVVDTQTLSIRTENIEWVHDVNIRGPAGGPGADGTPGKDGADGEKGDDGYATCEIVSFAPAKGPKGKLFIDNLNRVYVTTGL